MFTDEDYFLTVHTFDRQTDRQKCCSKTVCCILQSHGKNDRHLCSAGCQLSVPWWSDVCHCGREMGTSQTRCSSCTVARWFQTSLVCAAAVSVDQQVIDSIVYHDVFGIVDHTAKQPPHLCSHHSHRNLFRHGHLFSKVVNINYTGFVKRLLMLHYASNLSS